MLWLVIHSLRHVVVVFLCRSFFSQYPFPCHRLYLFYTYFYTYIERNTRAYTHTHTNTVKSHCSSQLMLLSDRINGCGFELTFFCCFFSLCYIDEHNVCQSICASLSHTLDFWWTRCKNSCELCAVLCHGLLFCVFSLYLIKARTI